MFPNKITKSVNQILKSKVIFSRIKRQKKFKNSLSWTIILLCSTILFKVSTRISLLKFNWIYNNRYFVLLSLVNWFYFLILFLFSIKQKEKKTKSNNKKNELCLNQNIRFGNLKVKEWEREREREWWARVHFRVLGLNTISRRNCIQLWVLKEILIRGNDSNVLNCFCLSVY